MGIVLTLKKDCERNSARSFRETSAGELYIYVPLKNTKKILIEETIVRGDGDIILIQHAC